MTERSPSSATIRKRAGLAFRTHMREQLAPQVPAPAPARTTAPAPAAERRPVQMTSLPYLARRLLRIVAQHEHISAERLYLEADFPGRAEADQLTLLGLIVRHTNGAEFTFEITPAGAQCVANEPPRKSAHFQPTGDNRHA